MESKKGITVMLHPDGTKTISVKEEPITEAEKKRKQEEEDFSKALADLTPKQRVAYFILEHMLIGFEESGVDISYFPFEARCTLLNTARELPNALEYADNAII